MRSGMRLCAFMTPFGEKRKTPLSISEKGMHLSALECTRPAQSSWGTCKDYCIGKGLVSGGLITARTVRLGR